MLSLLSEMNSKPHPKLRICLAGVTGWTGRAVAAGIAAAPDLELASAVSRKAAGQTVGQALGLADQNGRIHASVEEALVSQFDVLIDYTSSKVVKTHALTAIERGVAVVIGT